MKFFYLRDKHKRPVATVAFEDYPDSNLDVVGWAVATCNPADAFNKRMARTIVSGRLKTPRFMSLKGGRFGVKPAIIARIANNFDHEFPSRASKAARLWLGRHPEVTSVE